MYLQYVLKEIYQYHCIIIWNLFFSFLKNFQAKWGFFCLRSGNAGSTDSQTDQVIPTGRSPLDTIVPPRSYIVLPGFHNGTQYTLFYKMYTYYFWDHQPENTCLNLQFTILLWNYLNWRLLNIWGFHGYPAITHKLTSPMIQNT